MENLYVNAWISILIQKMLVLFYLKLTREDNSNTYIQEVEYLIDYEGVLK